MASLIDKVVSYLRSEVTETAHDYEVDEYVLERREPDPEPRVRTYDEPVTADDVSRDDALPSGIYLLQELKSNGMAGEVLWEEELEIGEEA